MPGERSDQPSRVSTQDIPRAPDEHVTTSDLYPGRDGPRLPGESAPSTAAAAPDEEQSADDQPGPAPGDDEPQRRRRHRDRPAERKAARLKSELEAARAQVADQEVRLADLEALVKAKIPPPAPAKEPLPADFPGDRSAYNQALAKWDSEKNAPAALQPRATRTPAPAPPPRPANAPTDDAIAKFQKEAAKVLGADRLADLQEVENVRIDDVMSAFILEGGEPGIKAYAHLLDNPEESVRIDKMGLVAKTKAMQKLIDQAKTGAFDDGDEIESEPLFDSGSGDDDYEDTTPPPARNTRETRAPTPPSDTRPRGNAPVARKLETLKMDDYAQVRRQEILRRTGKSY